MGLLIVGRDDLSGDSIGEGFGTCAGVGAGSEVGCGGTGGFGEGATLIG